MIPLHTRTYCKIFFAPVCHFERSAESSFSNNLETSLTLRVRPCLGFAIAFSIATEVLGDG